MKFFKKGTSLGTDAVFLTVSRMMVAVIGVVTSMLLARFRTLEEYGTYSQILMATELITTLFLLGLPNSINYFLARAETEKEKQKFLSVYLTISTILTAIISLCLLFAMPLIIDYFNNPLITGFAYVFAIYPWSMLMINSLSNVCVIYGRANKLVFFNVIHALITLLLLLLAKIFELDFQAYMIMYMASTLAFGVVSVLWIRLMSKRIVPKIDLSLIKQIFVFSVPMGLASVVGTLNGELDKLVIGRFFSTEEYAIFANAAKTLPVTMLSESLTAVLLPCVVRLLKKQKNERTIQVWSYAIKISFCLMCLIAGGLFVFAPDVMSLFYSEKYVTDAGVAVFRVYSSILLFRFTYWGMILNATGKTKFVFYSSLLSMVLNFVGNIVSYYILGFIGPAISTFVVTFIIAFAQLWFSKNILQTKFSKIFPWKSMAKFLLQTICLGGFFWFLKYVVLQSYQGTVSIVISICMGIVWALLYGAINFKTVIKNWKLLNSQRSEGEDFGENEK